MNLVDSCGWIEYFSNGKNASFFEEPIVNIGNLIVPSVCIYEVFKKIRLERSEEIALYVTSQMQQGRVVGFDSELAFLAAEISLNQKMPMADSIILATSIKFNAMIWTQDQHFSNIIGVNFIKA